MFDNKMRVSLTDLILLLVVASFVITGIYLSRTDLLYFQESFIREDGLVEWLTVIALLIGAGICLFRAFKFRKKGIAFVAITVMAALVLVFGAGEEISWGQRILGIETPEYFRENNLQGETNLHNLKVGEVKVNKLVFSLILFICVAFYLLFFPILYRYSGKIRSLFDRTGIPVPKFIHLIAFALFFLLAEFIPDGKKAELVEFAGAVIFFLIILQPANKEKMLRQ